MHWRHTLTMHAKRRIYADTSVIGGCLDDEFGEWSNRFVDYVQSGGATIVVSDLTLLELEGAPEEVRAVLGRVPSAHREDVELTREARDLASAYISAGVVVVSKLVDAQHIAIATVCRADVVVSWNFKHIVNLDRIHAFNSVNLREGYSVIEIRTPQEVVPHEEDEETN